MWNQIIAALAGFLLLFGIHIDTPPMVRGEATASSQSALTTIRTVNKTMEARRQQFTKDMAKKAEDVAKKNQENIQSFTKKLASIQDENKKATAITIAGKFAVIHTNRMLVWERHLTTMSMIVETIGQRIEAGGNASVAFSSSVSAAEKAIDEAMTAVTAQAGKTYVISVSGETKLQSDAEKTRQSLALDISSIQKKMDTAKTAVAGVLIGYRSLLAESSGAAIVSEGGPTSATSPSSLIE